MSPPRRVSAGMTMYLKVSGWGGILAPGAKPHEEVASGLSTAAGFTTATRASGRLRRRKTTGTGAKALASKSFGPVRSVKHPGIKADPYLERGAATFPTFFGRALAAQLRMRLP